MPTQDLQAQVQKSIDHLKQEFASLQIGRASASLVDSVTVEVYGAASPLKQVANISCPDAKTIKIEPWDKSLVGDIEKAVHEANIGITPQNMGESIFLPIPPMTEERRKDIVKKVHQLAEDTKISIRNSRHDAMKFIKLQKEENEISEDQQKDLESDVQEIIDKSNKEIEELSKKKEQEILTV